MPQQAQQFDTSSVCMLPQAELWVPAVGRLVLRLLYLCLKGVAPMELRPQNVGWAGPPGLWGCGCHAADAFCYKLGGKRRRNWCGGWGGTEEKKVSNAMSHSALAVWEGDREGGMGGAKGENTFACCMKLDTICHPSWAASWVRALVLTGLCLPPPQSYPLLIKLALQ